MQKTNQKLSSFKLGMRVRRFFNHKLTSNLLLLLVLVPVGFLIAMPFLWMLTASLKVRGHVSEGPMLFPDDL